MESEEDYMRRAGRQGSNAVTWVSGTAPTTVERDLPPSQDTYEAGESINRIHNLIDGIESRVFPTPGIPTGKDAVEVPPEPLAVMLRNIRQRTESAEQRLRNFLERL